MTLLKGNQARIFSLSSQASLAREKVDAIRMNNTTQSASVDSQNCFNSRLGQLAEHVIHAFG